MVVTRPPGRHAIITVDFDLENGSLKSADVSISSLKAGWLEHAEADTGPVPPVPPNEAPTLPGAAGTEAQDPPTGATVVAPPDGQERGGEVPETAQTMANRQEEVFSSTVQHQNLETQQACLGGALMIYLDAWLSVISLRCVLLHFQMGSGVGNWWMTLLGRSIFTGKKTLCHRISSASMRVSAVGMAMVDTGSTMDFHAM